MCSLINCIENTLKSNTEAYLKVLLINYGISLQLHRIEKGEVEKISVTTKADISKSLNGKYFLIYSPSSSYYVWYNILGTAADPLITGKISVEVAISENDSANTVATKTVSVINTIQDFSATANNNIISITNRITGNAIAPSAGTSTFTVATITAGLDPDDGIEYLEVYGKKAGPVSKSTYYTITGIVTGDELVPVDAYSAGTFTRGWLYTLDVDVVKTGDTLVMTRADSRQRRYIVKEPNILGTTNSVFMKYELSAIGD